MKLYDWAVIGGGIAGISLSEILTREGHSVALLEKNSKLASSTSSEFHEWVHTGSLYTLLKDDMKTLKYILGSLDDLLEFYSSFNNMNLIPTSKGLKINETNKPWFNPSYINFRYRIKNRKFILNWIYAAARSLTLIEEIRNHDWLRRRAGILDKVTSEYYLPILKNFLKLINSDMKFFEIESTDFTTNSRNLIRDMISTSCNNGLDIFTEAELIKIDKSDKYNVINTSKGDFNAKNVVISLGGELDKFSDVNVKKNYAPMIVVKNVSDQTKSFVELDYFKNNCINIIRKSNTYGLIGGISLKNEEDLEKYFDYMIKEHKKNNPEIEVVKKYVGIKNEISIEKESRNYLFHINQVQGYKNVWSAIPGKFTLAFSMAPEFYRIVYQKNPRKFFQTFEDKGETPNLVAETVWEDSKN
tara:strand:- start:190 stop:1434 length:1245 start_codon:yes stop_codon:yes gene_type:complete